MILNVWLRQKTLEGATLLELHSSVSVASGMSHHEWNQAAMRYSSQLLIKTKTDTSVAVAVLVMNLRIDAKRRSSK